MGLVRGESAGKQEYKYSRCRGSRSVTLIFYLLSSCPTEANFLFRCLPAPMTPMMVVGRTGQLESITFFSYKARIS